ncbi:hypothetical protein V2J09_019900 [Rumex salicifolius]
MAQLKVKISKKRKKKNTGEKRRRVWKGKECISEGHNIKLRENFRCVCCFPVDLIFVSLCCRWKIRAPNKSDLQFDLNNRYSTATEARSKLFGSAPSAPWLSFVLNGFRVVEISSGSQFCYCIKSAVSLNGMENARVSVAMGIVNGFVDSLVCYWS